LLAKPISTRMTLHGAISCLKTTPGYAVKYTVEHYRKDGVSGEAFTRWFTQQFLPRAIPILKKHNILRHAVVSGRERVILLGRAH